MVSCKKRVVFFGPYIFQLHAQGLKNTSFLIQKCLFFICLTSYIYFQWKEKICFNLNLAICFSWALNFSPWSPNFFPPTKGFITSFYYYVCGGVHICKSINVFLELAKLICELEGDFFCKLTKTSSTRYTFIKDL